ncbi:hypothetical protein [Rossellomorea sp. NRS-1567]|uniref:hypothetical protein n=1 Tax=Rossellomorea sp. NRS-1567 TaxID=3233901 RepID=UPI003D26B34A
MSIFKRINFQQILIEHSIENHKVYVNKMEEFLESEIDGFNKRFEEETNGWSEEQKDEYGEYLSDDYWTLAETHPSLLRSSMLISSFSLFEKGLKDLANYYEKKIITSSDYSSNIKTTSKISIYLKRIEKKFGVDFSGEISEWNLIQNYYREVRNIIVHDGGEIDTSRYSEKIKFIEEMGVKIKQPSGELILQKGFCLNYLEVISMFFQKFFNLIDNQRQD